MSEFNYELQFKITGVGCRLWQVMILFITYRVGEILLGRFFMNAQGNTANS